MYVEFKYNVCTHNLIILIIAISGKTKKKENTGSSISRSVEGVRNITNSTHETRRANQGPEFTVCSCRRLKHL